MTNTNKCLTILNQYQQEISGENRDWRPSSGGRRKIFFHGLSHLEAEAANRTL
jgi:hypothetical protein